MTLEELILSIPVETYEPIWMSYYGERDFIYKSIDEDVEGVGYFNHHETELLFKRTEEDDDFMYRLFIYLNL